jgi:hypothetical protein
MDVEEEEEEEEENVIVISHLVTVPEHRKFWIHPFLQTRKKRDFVTLVPDLKKYEGKFKEVSLRGLDLEEIAPMITAMRRIMKQFSIFSQRAGKTQRGLDASLFNPTRNRARHSHCEFA